MTAASIPNAQATTAITAMQPSAPPPVELHPSPLHPAPAVVFLGYLALVAAEYGGLTYFVPVLRPIRFTTILAYVLFLVTLATFPWRDWLRPVQSKIVVVFIGLTALSTLWAVVQTYAAVSVRPLVDYFALVVVTLHAMQRWDRFDRLAVMLALLALFLLSQNLDNLWLSTRLGGFRATYFMGDGNDFGWGLNVIAPLVLPLVFGRRSLLTRALGLAGFAACVIGVVGTQSRGATIGLAAALLYALLFVAKHRIIGILSFGILALGVVILAPSQYFTRMLTVADFEQDNSAQGRLQAWEAATRMALDHPLGVGAGNFNSAYGRSYRPDPGYGRIGYGAGRWISAHSIYFKVLGEYGFPGLVLLLWMLWANVRDNQRARRRLIEVAAWPRIRWPAFLNMSIVGFAVTGIFLGGFSYPHLFLLTGLTLAAGRLSAAEGPAAG